MSWLIMAMGYLLGSIPTGYIMGRMGRGVDIRQVGDGNMGAANAFRQLGPRTGLVVGILDAAKGAVAILIAQASGVSQVVVMLTGATAVIGHNWPLFLGFRGGRGESTTIGIMLTLLTPTMLIVGALAILALILRKGVIFASAVMFIPLPLACWLLEVSLPLIIYSIGLPCLVGFTHFLRTGRAMNASGTRSA